MVDPSSDIDIGADVVPESPFVLFNSWFSRAQTLPMCEAVTLATATPDGKPSSRIVLFKGMREGEIYIFTNYGSRKAQELDANPRAALTFYWSPFARQIRIEGAARRASRAASEEYFATRPRGSQIGAWASEQSKVMVMRAALHEQVQQVEKRFAGSPVACPEFWGGYAIAPTVFEFWQGMDDRLHERLLYEKDESGAWQTRRLFP